MSEWVWDGSAGGKRREEEKEEKENTELRQKYQVFYITVSKKCSIPCIVHGVAKSVQSMLRCCAHPRDQHNHQYHMRASMGVHKDCLSRLMKRPSMLLSRGVFHFLL